MTIESAMPIAELAEKEVNAGFPLEMIQFVAY